MKKKIFKISFAVFVAVSMFFVTSIPVLAVDELGKFDGSYAFSPNTAGTSIAITATGILNNQTNSYYHYAKETFMVGRFVLDLEEGHIYSGTMSCNLDLSSTIWNSSGSVSVTSSTVSFSVVPLSGPGWYVSGASFTGGAPNGEGSGNPLARVVFNNFTVSSNVTVTIPVYISFTQSYVTNQSLGNSQAYITSSPVSTVYNDLYDDILSQDGSSVQDSIYQQQQNDNANTQEIIDNQNQIAQEQASQSAQQHDELINGWDSSGASSTQESQQAQLEDFENQQDSAMDDAQGNIDGFTEDNFNTDAFTDNIMAIGVVSTIFNGFWMSFGQYTVYLVLCLTIGVAGYILKVRR